ncbi:AraC family transcriptional regulator [Paraburkholderia edwinii]|jgi:AraC-like DNA-binding protein|uniref:AraC family transcriptional regulator n=1 Tax=Paraburkholderia edwinii TaxID=2861782 RepID=A0ABX8UX85_9BURK|nr:AraC family transcriptional regulator [Paraburkholderia edwinii]QYD73604.1 AraC family transcriptional regulator [Paraburkholderia edwinii]
MEPDVTSALAYEPVRTVDGWHDMVNGSWSMDCAFDRVNPDSLKGTCWRMGGLEFDVADVSSQQWTPLAGPGRRNWRNEMILAFITQTGVIELEQSGVKTRLTNESLLLIDPSRKYVQTGESDTRGMALRIPRSALEARGMHFTGREMFIPDPTSPDVRMVKSLIASAAAHSQRSRPGSANLVAEHLVDLMQILAEDPAAPRRTRSAHVALASAKRFIERNVSTADLNLDMVARAAGVSSRYIAKLFASEGTTAMRYLWHTRLERARTMLVNGSAKARIGEIAWQCGFANAAHFSRAFKQRFGVSPNALQRSLGDASQEQETRGPFA